MVRTTLAARVHTSRSDDTESRVILRHETREGDKSEMSWRHSTASVRRIARVISRDLVRCSVSRMSIERRRTPGHVNCQLPP